MDDMNIYGSVDNIDIDTTSSLSATDRTLMEFTEDEIRSYQEGELTKKEKLKFLLLTPLTNTIIKFVLIGLGLVSLVIWLVSMFVPNVFNGLYSGFTAVIGAINNIMPFSVFEIGIIAVVVGCLAYFVYTLIRVLRLDREAKLLRGRQWIQFGYSMLAVLLIIALLFSFGYGISSSRTSLYKATATEGQPLYATEDVTEQEMSETLLYLIDKLNTLVVNVQENPEPSAQAIVYSAKRGLSAYNAKGSKTTLFSNALNTAFNNAAQELPALKGNKIIAKDALAGPIFNAMNVGSMYSPLTGEVLLNPYYPEVAQPMLIAKAMVKQRGYQNDAQAEMMAYIICTRYSDNPYVQYSAYFHAYLATGSKLATRNSATYATLASALKTDIKKEVIAYTKKLDSLYGNSSSLQFTDAGNNARPNQNFLEYPELMINYYRQKMIPSDLSPLPAGHYVCGLVDLYRQDAAYQTGITEVANKYATYNETIEKVEKPGGTEQASTTTEGDKAPAAEGENATTTEGEATPAA